MDVGPGCVPTSSNTLSCELCQSSAPLWELGDGTNQMFGWRIGPKALKNHRCELIFFAFFSLRQKTTWTGTRPRSADLNLRSGSIETGAAAVQVRKEQTKKKRGKADSGSCTRRCER